VATYFGHLVRDSAAEVFPKVGHLLETATLIAMAFEAERNTSQESCSFEGLEELSTRRRLADVELSARLCDCRCIEDIKAI
jgi:hypothetical protein